MIALITLSKADTIGNPRDWPPEQSARKAGLIKEALDYLITAVDNKFAEDLLFAVFLCKNKY